MQDFSNKDGVQALIWQDKHLLVLDQRALPERVHYHSCATAVEVSAAIASMQVRGAPAIGIAAAYAVVLSVQQHYCSADKQWLERVDNEIAILAASRPTAVNLSWALTSMRRFLATCLHNPIKAMLAQALLIHKQDISANRKMAELGADIIGQVAGVLTHCNAGALATGGYGTALGVIRSVVKRHESCQVFANETRPWLQGARLTAWELAEENIPVTLIADSAAAVLMRSAKVAWVIVGADRIAANGDVANKIGTYALAVLAKQHAVKMMVVAPTSSFDFSCAAGELIRIEERESSEFLPACYRHDSSLVSAWNPVFDVTPCDLIDVIVSERGAVFQPFKNGIMDLFIDD